MQFDKYGVDQNSFCMTYILAIDQGTSSTKTIIFDVNGQAVFKASEPLNSIFLHENHVEQDPLEIYNNVLTSVRKCLTGFKAQGGDIQKIVTCGISNQRETFVLWDQDGEPLHHAVVWQCKRSVNICERMKKMGLEDQISQATGLIIDPYFSASKVIWLYENNERIKNAIDRGDTYFGTVDTWLLYKLTNGTQYATDFTNASRTMLFNIYELKWDENLLKAFGLSELNLPTVHPSSHHFGETSFDGLLDEEIPISSLVGDSHAAAFGEQCFHAGEAKATLGTGCSVLMNIGDSPKKSNNGMVTTICWSIEGRVDYALEGIIVSAGATIEWLRNQLGLFERSDELEQICLTMENTGGVYVVPAFSGLGAPHWEMSRKASIEGLTFESNKDHVIRAGVESVLYQIKDVIAAMEIDSGTKLNEIKVDGGMTSNPFVLQFLADLLERQVTSVEMADVSALGAAYLSGLQVGVFSGIEAVQQLKMNARISSPNLNSLGVRSGYEGWKNVLSKK